MARSWANPITIRVVGRRCRINVSTSMRLAKEKPQSPCTMASSQCQ
jgi:hypothetical protein